MGTRFKAAAFFVFLAFLGFVFLGYTPFKPAGTFTVEERLDASESSSGEWDRASVVTIEYFVQADDWVEVYNTLDDALVDAIGWLEYHAQEGVEYFVPVEDFSIKGPYIAIYDDGFTSGYAMIQFSTWPWADFGFLRSRLAEWSDAEAEFVVETNWDGVWETTAGAFGEALSRAHTKAQALADRQGINLGNAVSAELDQDGSLVTARVTYSYYLRLPFLP